MNKNLPKYRNPPPPPEPRRHMNNKNTTFEERGYDFNSFDLFDDLPKWPLVPLAFILGFVVGCFVHHL